MMRDGEFLYAAPLPAAPDAPQSLPAVPPLSEDRKVLAELVACKDLEDAMITTRSDPYYLTQAGHMEAECDWRWPAAWKRARALLCAQPQDCDLPN